MILFDTIEKYLKTNKNPIAASAALYVLNLASCSLGRDKPEEAQLFQSHWNQLKSMLEETADRSEFLSNAKMIQDNIEQVLMPEKYDYVEHREESTLERSTAKFLVHLN